MGQSYALHFPDEPHPSPDLQHLILQYSHLFAEPTTLPLTRGVFYHNIPL